MRKPLTFIAIMTLFGLCAGGCVQAAPQYFQFHDRLTGDASNDESLGSPSSIARSGEWLIAGASHALVHDGQASGRVYVFRRDTDGTWRLTQRIPNPEPQFAGGFGGFFGSVTTIKDDRMLISAHGNRFPTEDDSFIGAAYLFELDHASGQWELKQRLTAPEPGPGSFGARIELLDDDYALIARPSAETPSGADVGIIYVYEPDPDSDEWESTQQWFVPGASRVTSMAADGDLVAVGKGHIEVDGVPNIGSVYMFEQDASGTYHHTTTIEPDTSEAGEFGLIFGRTALHDGMLLVGARGSVTGDAETGAAWLYRRNAPDDWEAVQRLAPALHPARGLNAFGAHVAMTDAYILVSAPPFLAAGDPAPNGGVDHAVVGIVYVYLRSDDGTGELLQILAPPDAGAISIAQFGTGLHHDGSQLFIGAHGVAVDGQSLAGAIYILAPSDLPPVELEVDAEVMPPVVDAGGEATWIIHATNTSPDTTATGVSMFNPVQNGMAFISGGPGCALDERDIVHCEVGSMAPGAIAEVSLTMRVDHPQGGSRNSNLTTVLAREPDPNTVNNIIARAVEVVLPEPPPEPEPEPERRSGRGGMSLLGLLLLIMVAGVRSFALHRSAPTLKR